MFGSILYEHHIMKKEEKELRERMILLAEETRNSMGYTLGDTRPDYIMKPVAEA
jgi:hypothetical protein